MNNIYRNINIKKRLNYSIIKGKDILLIYILIILYLNLIMINSNDFLSEINITINGIGKQKILSNSGPLSFPYSNHSFNSLPNQTLVNGILQNNSDGYVYNLVYQTNIITMRWNYQITNCFAMFDGLNNIISIDLSNFDTSQVENFESMFANCISLKYINLNNMNTSLAKNMVAMFAFCLSLETLNLSSFDTSKVTSMDSMFFNCKSLKSLDLSNFNTLELKKTTQMFFSCSSLLFLNLKNFDTTKVISFDKMFSDYNSTLIYCTDDAIIKSLLQNYINNCSHSCFLNKWNPIEIWEEEDIFKYKSSYYNDICVMHYTENEIDKPLTDQKIEFISNETSICGECKYIGYDIQIKKAKCECKEKIKLNSTKEKKNMYKIEVNLKIMKCYKTAFTKNGLKKNIGNYIILSILFITTICLILFLINGFSRLKDQINNINSNNINLNNINDKTSNDARKKNKTIMRKSKKGKKVKKLKKKMHANIKIKEEYNYNVINFNNNINEDKSKNKSNQNQIDSHP